MSKRIDITEQLDFEESPKLIIKGKSYEVNDDAPTMLKIMQLMGDGNNVSGEDVITMYQLIFSESERKKLEKLKLKFKDFQTVVMSAINLITGTDSVGE